LEDLYLRHPEIEDIQIEKPIIVCGMPRTGTTHLLNLMAADPNLRHMPYWESLEPMPVPSEVSATPDPRIARCEQTVQFLNGLAPHFKSMYEFTPELAHEEIQIMALDIAGMLFETMANVPSWRDHYKATDQTPSYLYMRRVLKAMTFLRGGKRWVLKSPQHLEQFGPLLTAFPDATLVITHRDPVAITASMATMVAYTRRLSTSQPDPEKVGAYWADRTADLLGGCLAARDNLPVGQVLDLTLDQFIADKFGSIKRIYALANQPLEAEALGNMEAYDDSHRRGRHGAVDYRLADLGLSADALRERMRPYSERFGLRDEGLS